MIWVTMIAIILLWSFGWLLVFMNGMVPKMTAPWLFIATIPMIASKQVLWTEAPAIVQISLPLNIVGPFFSVALLFALTAIWNAFEYMGRDFVGRKRPIKR